MNTLCIHAYISGRVQGVCYRAFVHEQALQENVSGWAKNLPDGRVEVMLQGSEESIERVLDRLWQGPPLSDVSDVASERINSFVGICGFSIG